MSFAKGTKSFKNIVFLVVLVRSHQQALKTLVFLVILVRNHQQALKTLVCFGFSGVKTPKPFKINKLRKTSADIRCYESDDRLFLFFCYRVCRYVSTFAAA